MPVAELERPTTRKQASPKPQRSAGMEFPESDFVTINDIPIFSEHETKSAAEEGRVLKFGPAELQAVCARCNRRIVETGDYAAIVIGHTPSPEEAAAGAPQPDLIGMAGPFRMGTIGAGDKQRTCILADFHVYRDELGKMRKHPRRSPELWLESDYSEMFLDPIALLGAEAPRLDMGLLYSANRNGRRVEKYAAACAMPSAGNVNTLKFSAADAAATSPAKPQEAPTVALTPEDCKMIVEMFMSTDAGQYLQKAMAEDAGTNAIVPGESEPPMDGDTLNPEIAAPGGAGDPAHPFDAPEPNAGPAAGPPASAESIPPAAPEIPAKPPMAEAKPEGDDKEPAKYAAACSSMDGMSDEHMEKYLAGRWKNHPKHTKYAAGFGSEMPAKLPDGEMNGETSGGAKPPVGSPDDAERGGTYAGGDSSTAITDPTRKVQGANVEAYARKFKAIEQRLAAAVHRERYSRLRETSQSRVLDVAEEMVRCKDMDDPRFEDHMKVIREHYEKIPVGYYAVPDLPTDYQAEPTNTSHGSPEKYRAENVKKAERYCESRKANGHSVEFGEVLDMLEAGQPLPA